VAHPESSGAVPHAIGFYEKVGGRYLRDSEPPDERGHRVDIS
jgi:hypothetical protein